MTINCQSEHESLTIVVKLTEYTNMTIICQSEHESLTIVVKLTDIH